MFDQIKNFYKDGLWSIQRVKNAVGKLITEDEYKEITGEEYE